MAVKAKIDLFLKEKRFENAKTYFLLIANILHKQKDYVILGYFVYFTQYFSCKKEPKKQKKSSNPFEEEEEFENFFNVDDSDEDNEGEDGANKENDKSLHLFNDSIVSNGSINENDVSDSKETRKYVMIVDSYYKCDFAKDEEYWKFMMNQLFEVFF